MKQRSKQKPETGEIVLQDGTVISKWFYQPYSERPIPKNYAEWNQPFTYTRNPEREKLLKKIADAKKCSSYCSAQLLDARNRKLDTSVVTSPTTDQTVSQLKETEASELCVLSTGAEAGHPAGNKEVDPRLATRKPTETKAIELHATDPDDTQIDVSQPNDENVVPEANGKTSTTVRRKKKTLLLSRFFKKTDPGANGHRKKSNDKSKKEENESKPTGNVQRKGRRQTKMKKGKVTFFKLRLPWPGYPVLDPYGKPILPILTKANSDANGTISETVTSHRNEQCNGAKENDNVEVGTPAATSSLVQATVWQPKECVNDAFTFMDEFNFQSTHGIEMHTTNGTNSTHGGDNHLLGPSSKNESVNVDDTATSSLVQATVWQPKECVNDAFTFMDEFNFQSTHGIEMDTTNGTNSTHGGDNHLLGPSSKNESVNVDDTVNCRAISDNQSAQPELIMLDAEPDSVIMDAVPTPLTIVDTNFTFTFTDDDRQIVGPTLHIVNDIREPFHTTPQSTVALKAFLDEDEHLFANFLNIPDECVEADPTKINSTQNVSVDANSFFDDQDDYLFTAFEENFF